MNIIRAILSLYWQLIMFGINNLMHGLSGALAGQNAIVPIVVGAGALMIAFAIPGAILGALGQVLPIVLPILVLGLVIAVAWTLLSDHQKGKKLGTSIKKITASIGQFFQSLQWKLSLGQPKGEVFWDPQDLWAASSAQGISAPIGTQEDGRQAVLTLNDDVPHILLAGRSGSGKSNLLHVIIHGLAHNYSPDELEFYLMDYKDGVEFNSYGGDKTSGIQGLPHARLVATEGDAEYGITILEHLLSELKRRNNLFSNSGARKIEEYRQRGGTMPRILLVIDEFQVLFQVSDAITTKVNALFSDLLSRGRSAGIHILLATQSLRALLGVSGFGGVKAKLNCRIALACSKEESEFILSSSNYAASELKAEGNTRFGILNSDDGHNAANTKFVIPFATPGDCAGHQAFFAGQASGTPKKIKVFSGARLPQMPNPAWFSGTQRNTSQVILGEELNFESGIFSFEWERHTGNNLLIVGYDEVVRNGLLRSLAFSAAKHFSRIIYFSTNRNFTSLGFSDPHVVVKRFDWDGNIADIVADYKTWKTLLIVDSLENAKMFSPPNPYETPSAPPSPAELFKQFLEEAPQYGSHIVAFSTNWKRFENQCRDYLRLFDLRIGFNLDEVSAGSLVGTSTGMFKGLENPTKAVFSDLQRNELVLFRPFVVQ